MFVAPIFVLYLLSIILTAGAGKAKLDIVSAPESFISIMEEEAAVNLVNSEEEAINNLKDKNADGYIKFSENTPIVTVEGADPNKTKLVVGSINKALSKISSESIGNVLKSIKVLNKNNVPIDIKLTDKPEIKYMYGSEDMEIFDYMAPLLMGFFIFFFIFLIAGVSFLRERISGTLERILATPLRRSEIVMGYFLGFGLFVSLQTLLIQSFIVYGLGVTMEGSFWAVLVVDLLLAAGSLALGTLLSTFARNEFQLFQFIPLIIVPQVLFSGIFDLSSGPQWVQVLSKVFPMTYGAEALRDIMIRGKSLSYVGIDLVVLLGYALLFIVLNIVALKKYRTV
jgi:ABC-2 type transport system permease protein